MQQEAKEIEAKERVIKALGNLADALHEVVPQFEKAAGVLRELGKYAPIPVEGTVK